jgi:ABC-type uncharacterized transport system involved in gliding motility auxiliary subunit
MRWRFLSSVIGVLAVLAIVVGINMVADARLAGVRLDLTEQHLYTLSPGTRAILAGLKEPVTLRLFYSRQLGAALPSYGTYADRVREMLEEYAQAANGKVRLEFLNPEPFSDTEDRAMAYGLQGVPLDQSGEQVYFGIAGTNLLDDERNIAFLQPDRERFLEYDLSRLVYELSNPARPVLGVMSSLPLDGDPRMMMMTHGQGGGRPYAIMTLLRQTNQVRMVPTTATTIDPDIKVLLVAQAQHLSDATQYAIDQFVMRGGALMAMVDPYSEAEAATPDPTGEPPADLSSDLKKLFDAWGVGFDPTAVVGDPDGAWRVRAPEGSSGGAQAVDYLAWFNIHGGIAHSDPATADLQQVTVAASGYLTKKPDAKIDFTPLLTSSAESGLIPVDKVKVPDPAAILATFRPQGGPRVIAARLHGMLHSAFTAAPALPPPAKGDAAPAERPAYIAETKTPANIVVVADSDILADRFWVRQGDFFGQQEMTPFSDNGAFVANLVDTLAGGDALIGLRARGAAIRPFDMIVHMQAAAEARYQQTEQALQQHLDATEKQLQQLRQGSGAGGGGKDPGSVVLTPEQQKAIDAARQDIVDTRTRLRAVQFDLNRDIERLQTELLIFNVVMVPVLVALAAILLAVVRRQRRMGARA